MSTSSSSECYKIAKSEGIDQLYKTTQNVPQPKRGQVLVRMHATSLNYRDLMVVSGQYSGATPSDLIPLSDGSGEIVQIGEDVTEFKVGDKVCGTFFQKWVDGTIPADAMHHALGGSMDGVLSKYCVFEKTGVIKFPSYMSYEEAATLPCAALTAWNALSHNNIQNIGPGQTVLVLGTGGVSIFAIQFAAAAGARVIVTSSSDDKLEKARSLGATDFINYSKDPNWDDKVKELTGGVGVDHVVEVGGGGTLPKSLNSVRAGGQVHMIGVLSKPDSESNNVALQVLFKASLLRGVLVGSRGMFEAMNSALEVNKIHPVIDKVFSFDETKEAYKYLESQKHVGKVVIRID
jgi:NADPH:quinone reductase-like Zn-dependent oxidoreductase